MHRESTNELAFHSYSNVRIGRPLLQDIEEVKLRHQLMNEAYSEEVNQFEEIAC